MKRKMHWLKLTFFRIRAIAAYPLDAILGIVGTVLWHLPNFVLLEVSFDNMNFEPQFKSYLVLLYGLSVFGDGIQHTFFEALWQFGNNFIKGAQFDQILTKPCSNFIQVVTSRFDIDGIGAILWGGFCCFYGMKGIAGWNLILIIKIILAMASSGLFFVSINILTSSMAFLFYDNFFVTQTVFELHQFARFPKEIYPTIMRFLLTFVFPVFLATNYSANIIRKYTVWQNVLFIFCGYLFFRLSIFLWNICSRFYRSSGS